MKILFSICFSFLAFSGYCQVVFADPAHNQVDFASATVSNAPIDASTLPLATAVLLRVPILNLNLANNLPGGSCKVKIGLGSKLELDPNFDLNTTNTSAYFTWTAVNQGGQVLLTGDLVNPVPPGYAVTAAFRVKGSIEGSSTVTANFLVTNHNSSVILSDENPTNNTSFIPYTVVQVIPVSFTGITAKNENCAIKVSFSTEQELNVDRYEIEAGKDGIHYLQMGNVPAANAHNYNFSFPLTDNIKNPVIYVRVKSVDKDGKYQYTETRTVKGNCDETANLSLYPNPVINNQWEVFVKSSGALFNGHLAVYLTDMAGKKISSREFNLNNVRQFSYPTGYLPAGEYLLHIESNSVAPVTLKFQKH